MTYSEEQTLIRKTARDFATKKLQPTASKRDQEASFPKQEIKEMGKLGFLGMLVSKDYGGSDTGFLNYSICIEEIANGDGAISTIMAVQALASAVIENFGSNQQKKRFLNKIATGEHLASFMLTEPQAGSDASNLIVKALKEGNHYILSGTKQFITSGANSNISIVFAVTDDTKDKRGISAFIVPTNLPGYTVSAIEKKMGQRCSDTAQITFDGVKLTPDLLLGEEGDGYKIALSNLEGGRIAIAAQATGMAQAAFDYAINFAKERTSFGKSIIDHQAVSFRLANMATNIEASRLMYQNAARLRDESISCLKEASMAKLFTSEIAEKICSEAIQTMGGYGYLEDFSVERIFRDVRVCQIYEGTSDIQRLVISKEISKND